MAQPTPYVQSTDFSSEEASNVGGRSTVRTAALDAELGAIQESLTETQDNLELIQRDDGKLRDGVVEIYALSATARAALQGALIPRGDWSSPTAYSVNDLVRVSGIDYFCVVAHTSGTFAADLAAGKWLLPAAGSAAAAALSASSAAAQAALAAGQVTIATAQAGTATTQAGIATTASGTATTQAGLATAAKTAAETARDAALAADRIYASTAAGLAGTTNGQYFYIPSASSSESLLLYLNSAGSAVLQKTMVSYQGAVLSSVEQATKASPKVRNIFDSSAVTASSCINSTTGAVAAAPGFFATDYMPVVPAASYTPNKASFASAPNGLAYYDFSKTYISGSTTALVASTPVTVPANARFVRVTFSDSVLNTLMVMNSASVPTYFQAAGDPAFFPWLENAIVAASGVRARARFNLVDADLITAGVVLSTSTGNTSANGGYFVTGYIPVSVGIGVKIYPASVAIGAPFGMAYYDKDKVFISGVDGAFTSGQEFLPPANAVYARFTFNNSQLTTGMVLPSTITAGDVSTHTAAKLSDFKQWAGKTVMQLGDSIAANTNWMATVATYLGITTVTNNSLSGRAMVDALKTSAGVALVSGDFTSVDLVHLHLGTNDFTNATTLGTISDSTATASFYGRTKLAIETMLGYKPTLRICIATLLQRTGGTGVNAGGWTLNDYSTALRNVAELYACPINDLAKTSGINALTIATYLSDGLHPNATGYTAGLINPSKGFFDGIHPTT